MKIPVTAPAGVPAPAPTPTPTPTPTPAPFNLTVMVAPAEAGVASPLSFRITGADGTPVTEYDVIHEKQLHLFAMRDSGVATADRFSDFQHVHPTYAGAGVWKRDGFTAPNGGTTRLIADITTGGKQSWIQASQVVKGVASAAPPASNYAAKVVSSMAMGDAIMATVQLTGPDGKPVANVDPYLAAPAHWALFNTGSTGSSIDAAHAHPMKFSKGSLQFHVELPKSGAYQGWIQFRPAGAGLVTVPLSIGSAPSGDAASPAAELAGRRR